VSDTDLRSIHVDEFFAHPPWRVWAALTDPEQMSRWLMPTDFRPEVGHRFTFRAQPIPRTGFSGVIACEVLDVRPPELLSISWNDAHAPRRLDWTVTWTLRPEGHGTRLFLEHSGFDPDDPTQQLARTFMSGGWSSRVLRKLHDLLDLAA
jgi:uncharacterized protein YndB with AHSA1/START domain